MKKKFVRSQKRCPSLYKRIPRYTDRFQQISWIHDNISDIISLVKVSLHWRIGKRFLNQLQHAYRIPPPSSMRTEYTLPALEISLLLSMLPNLNLPSTLILTPHSNQTIPHLYSYVLILKCTPTFPSLRRPSHLSHPLIFIFPSLPTLSISTIPSCPNLPSL